MNKEKIMNELSNIIFDNYKWKLFFYRFNEKNENPYLLSEKKLSKSTYLKTYSSKLVNCINNFQFKPVEEIEEYNGYNNKTSCDTMLITDIKIKDYFNKLRESMLHPTTDNISKKYNGYIVYGTSLSNEDDYVLFAKTSSPNVDPNKGKSVFFTENSNQLEQNEDIKYRLYFNVDFFVLRENLYSFNNNFEKFFNMESSLKTIKDNAIQAIMNTNAFVDNENFSEHAKKFKANKTFVTLNQEKVANLNNSSKRKNLAETLQFSTNEEDLLDSLNQEQINTLIKYLCLKLIKDDDTKELYEGKSIKKLK